VLVTYDANGGYGHPDHIQTHRVAMRAVDLAAEPSYRPDLGPAWQINKIYWGVMPVSALQAALDALPAEGTPFVKVERAEDTGVTVPDDAVTTVLDVGRWEDARMAALRAHATQIRVYGPYVALAGNVGLTMPPAEYYQLARGRLGVPDGDVETDLFAGIHRSR
jgi:N-acetyl-1-D-myo-inositol-2-amino-2-deoxy-alpha-D-glucopyranoside deacetylase